MARCEGVVARCEGVVARCEGVVARCEGVMARCEGAVVRCRVLWPGVSYSRLRGSRPRDAGSSGRYWRSRVHLNTDGSQSCGSQSGRGGGWNREVPADSQSVGSVIGESQLRV